MRKARPDHDGPALGLQGGQPVGPEIAEKIFLHQRPQLLVADGGLVAAPLQVSAGTG
jgi:hypothetical protein